MTTATLDSICDRISSGGTPSRKNTEYFTSDPAGHLWVKSKELIDGSISDTEEKISEEGFKNSAAKYFPEHTVLVAMYGANVGQLAWLRRRATVNQAVSGLVVNDKKADWRFVFYSLLQNRGDLTIQAQGAAQQNLNQDLIRQFSIPYPPLPVQRRIADILSSYDELIENCQRRIRLLETMARALYREWFVHFRFPGHEKHPRVASALGDIPQGWEVKKLGELFKTVLGGTPSREKPEFWEGGTIPWINSGKVNELRITTPSELITELALSRSAAKLMPMGTTVLAITGATLGQVSYLEIETTANQSVIGISDPSGLCSEWIYLTVTNRIDGIVNHASGGAQQHINKEVVNDVLVAPPPVLLAKEFKRLVAPMFREVATLLFKAQNLRCTRDLLLPRLLSGQIEIGNN